MKKIILGLSLIAITSIFLAGCGDKDEIGANKVKTFEYYKAHEKETNERVAYCKKKLKTITNSEKYKYFQQDCENAYEAEGKLRSFKHPVY